MKKEIFYVKGYWFNKELQTYEIINELIIKPNKDSVIEYCKNELLDSSFVAKSIYTCSEYDEREEYIKMLNKKKICRNRNLKSLTC